MYVEHDGEVSWLVLDRPTHQNALRLDMWERIPELVAEVADDPASRVMVLSSADPRFFAVGADISEFPTLRVGVEKVQRYNEAVAGAASAIESLEKPTIAMISGNCIGGGVELALACDLRLAAEGARFGIPAAKLGIVYPWQSTERLVQVVGTSKAKYLLFTGDIISSDVAERIGFIDGHHPLDELRDATTKVAHTIGRRSQQSVRTTKKIIARVSPRIAPDDTVVNALSAGSLDSADYREGIAAFLEKRRAEFPGAEPGSP